MKKGSGRSLGTLQGWAKLHSLEEASGDLFGAKGDNGAHAPLAADKTGDRCLLNAESFGGSTLGSEVLNEPFEDVHAVTSNRNTYILDYRNSCLQEYRGSCENLRMELKHRFKAARKYAGITQRDLADLLGITQATISEIETGKTSSTSYCARAAAICGVNPLWLEAGKGEMLPIKAEYRQTDIVEELHVSEASVVPAHQIQIVPVVSWVAAGAWSEAIDLYAPGYAEDFMPCPDRIGVRGFALRVEGDSMTSPYPGAESYPHGTYIYVDPDIAYKSGDPVIAKLTGQNKATFKIFVEDAGKLYLKPLNPQHPMIEIDEETQIIATLVGSYRKR